jgi:molybdate-binding protein
VEVGGRVRLYPAEATTTGIVPHDGVDVGGSRQEREGGDPARTLLLAGCDPAAGLLADELARTAGVRLIALPRGSRAALALLSQGLVHVAGVHLTRADAANGNARAAREIVGGGCRLLRAARWEEGLAVAPSSRVTSAGEAARSKLRWVGREPGSGARECQDELLEGRRPPSRLAADHRGVAEAVRQGWAEVGVCLRLACEEAGLGFLPVRKEDYDLCFPERLEGDYRIQALLQALRRPSLRAALADLPGYDSRDAGSLQRID